VISLSSDVGNIDAVRFYLDQVCLLCNGDHLYSSADISLLDTMEIESLRESHFSEDIIRSNQGLRDAQIAAGVLMRVDCIANFLQQVGMESSIQISVDRLRDILHAVRLTSGSRSEDKPLEATATSAARRTDRGRHDGPSTAIDDMDRLRILSRAALDFL
jgi:hypothetical protein